MRNAKRAGFTLVELMVAMALTVFVMIILTQAFATSLDTFSGMKGIGDMQQTLRTAGNVIRNDLSQYHFDGARRLSDMSAAGNPLIVKQAPQAGFFAVWQGSAPVNAASATSATFYVIEGSDSNGVPSFRAHDHVIYMTVTRRGNRQQNFFTTPLQDASFTGANLGLFFSKATAYDIDPVAQLPYATWAPQYQGGSSAFYSSQWAEVIYFLVQTGSTEEPNNPASQIGAPTFALYRAQFVMVPDGTGVSTVISNRSLATFSGLSCNLGSPNLTFYSPADAALGHRVVPDLSAFSPNSPTARVAEGATLLLPNVISFHVQTMPTGQGAVMGDGVYDTTKFSVAGYPSTGLQAIQITLRVFDNASRQTRQMTIVQDL